MSKVQEKMNIPEGWKQVTLGDLFDFKNGLNKEKEFFGHGTPIVNYTDVYKKTSLRAKDVCGLVDVHQNEKNNFEVKMGDVFFTRTSETLPEIGFSSVLLEEIKDCVFSGYILRARQKKNSLLPEYCGHSLRAPSIRKAIQRKSSMTTRALTSGRHLSEVDYIYPPISEQKRIVTVLETWDQAIEKLQLKIEIKKEVKKGLMQKLLTGKTRILGFADKWTEATIGSMGEVVTGSTPPKKDIANYGSEHCWVTAEDLGNKYVYDTVIKLSHKGKENSRFLPMGSILVTCIASIGKNGIAAVPLATNQQINSIVVNKDYSNEFVYYLLTFYRNVLESTAGAGAMKMLSKGEFQKIKFLVPRKDEQLKIADILITADKEIQALEHKLRTIQDQKKYLLNNLITGTIRTPESLFIPN